MTLSQEPIPDAIDDRNEPCIHDPVLIGEVRRAGWRRVARGAYVPRAEPSTPLQEAHAWRCLLGDEITFTGLTAAALRGWWLPALPPDVPAFIAIAEDRMRPRRVGLRVARHRSGIPSMPVDGLEVATPAEAILASARVLSLLDLVILGDAALHLGDCTQQDLRLAAAQRRRGSRALRRALPLFDGRSESPGETLLRVLHTSCGIQVQPQFVIRDSDRIVARADLYITGTRRLPEYDGAHHRDPAQYERDRRRERQLGALGWEPPSSGPRCGFSEMPTTRWGGTTCQPGSGASTTCSTLPRIPGSAPPNSVRASVWSSRPISWFAAADTGTDEHLHQLVSCRMCP